MSAYDAISSRITGLTLRPQSALRMGTLCLPSPAKSLLASRFCRDWREVPEAGAVPARQSRPSSTKNGREGSPDPDPRRSHPLWGSHYMRRSNSPVFTQGPLFKPFESAHLQVTTPLPNLAFSLLRT
jgi:hypothetical protein